MWTWYIALTLIFLSPFLMWEQVFKVVRRLLKWYREWHARDYGYERMIEEFGAVRWWEEPIDLDKCFRNKGDKKHEGRDNSTLNIKT